MDRALKHNILLAIVLVIVHVLRLGCPEVGKRFIFIAQGILSLFSHFFQEYIFAMFDTAVTVMKPT